MMKVLFFVIVIATVLTIITSSCPVDEVFDPCDCIELFGQTYFKCSRISDEELRKALTAMKGQNLTALQISNSQLKYIPYDLVSNMSVFRIEISHNDLFYLFDRPLDGIIEESLTELRLKNLEFDGGLDWTLLEKLKKLTVVTVTNTNLEHVTADINDIELPIETLELSNDELKDIHLTAFTTFPKLRNLILKGNALLEITRHMLPYPSNLEFLDLSNNKLSALPRDIFDEMPKLNSLLLHGNKFVILENSYMQKVWKQLFFFSVHDNPLYCDCSLSWILDYEKPFHFFGQCSAPNDMIGKELKKLNQADFRLVC